MSSWDGSLEICILTVLFDPFLICVIRIKSIKSTLSLGEQRFVGRGNSDGCEGPKDGPPIISTTEFYEIETITPSQQVAYSNTFYLCAVECRYNIGSGLLNFLNPRLRCISIPVDWGNIQTSQVLDPTGTQILNPTTSY